MQCDSFEYGLVSHASTSWHLRVEMFIKHLGTIAQNTAVYGCHHKLVDLLHPGES